MEQRNQFTSAGQKNHQAAERAEQETMTFLQKTLEKAGLACRLNAPTDDVPTYILQSWLACDPESDTSPSLLTEMFLSNAFALTQDLEAAALHIYVTLPLTVTAHRIPALCEAAIAAQTWLPCGCVCIYPEDKTVALRHTLYLRSAYDAPYLVDTILDVLEHLMSGVRDVLPLLEDALT